MEKNCFKCLRRLPLADFYAHGQMTDGHLGKCKDCTRRDATAHRAANHEKVCAYDRARARTPERRKAVVELQRESRARNPEKWAARLAVRRAVVTGALVRHPCQQCGSTQRVEAHHDDYSKPLAIEWLCFVCHRKHGHGQIVSDVVLAGEAA